MYYFILHSSFSILLTPVTQEHLQLCVAFSRHNNNISNCNQHEETVFREKKALKQWNMDRE